jgi:hypothetical protein
MALAGVLPDALSQLLNASRPGRPHAKQYLMDILGAETNSATDHNLIALVFPFQDRSWTDTKLPAYIRRD